jgi:hypothetical protein
MRTLVCALSLWVTASFGTASAQTEVLGPDQWPKTMSEAVEQITSGMKEEDKALIRRTSRNDLVLFHFSWGMGIRNAYGLWRGNRDLLVSACGRPCHPDDASMLIIEAVWTELRK